MSETGIVERRQETVARILAKYAGDAFSSTNAVCVANTAKWPDHFSGCEQALFRSLADRILDEVPSASLIDRQQKAIGVLLTAIEPFANEERHGDINGDWLLEDVGTGLTVDDLRAARSAKEQVVRILKGEGP